MKETSDIEKNIESLERELRAMGEPYSNGMPSDAYFTDFQSRLMSRIASEQVVVAPKKTVSPVSSPMRITAMLGVVVLLVAGFFYFNQPKNIVDTPAVQPRVVTEAPKAIDNETLYDISVKQTKQETKQNHSSMQDTNPPKLVESPKAPIVKQSEVVSASSPQQDMLNASSNFENMDELTVGDPESPVTYDKLSVDELESVLKILETNEFESER